MLRENSTRRLVALVLMGLCAISLRLTWGLSGEFPVTLGATAFAQQDECTPVTNIIGRGDQESEPFEISGRTFRVDFEADNPGETPGYAFFNVVDENDGIVQPDSQDISSDDPERLEGSATFSSGPGDYTIEIAAESADYTIDIEECDGAAAKSTSQPGASPGGNARQPSPSQDGQSKTKRELLRAGGPAKGPVPNLPGGGCPAEYPIKKDAACHR